MEYIVLFQNEKFKIIEFLGNVYIDIPKEGIPYVAFNNEEKFYPIMGYFSSKCSINVIKDKNQISLFFDNEVSLTEIVDFTNIISAKSTTLRPTTDTEGYDSYIRVLITL